MAICGLPSLRNLQINGSDQFEIQDKQADRHDKEWCKEHASNINQEPAALSNLWRSNQVKVAIAGIDYFVGQQNWNRNGSVKKHATHD